MMKRQQVIGNLLLVFVAVIWGTAFVFQRVGMDSIEPITFTASRMTLAAIVIGAVALLRRAPVPAGLSADADKEGKAGEKTAETGAKREAEEAQRAYSRNNILGGICCGFFLASASIFQQMGIVYTTAGKAGFITALYILLVPVIGFVLFRRRCTWLVWLAVLIGVAGMYLLCITEGFRLTRGDTLVCICALLFSGHILCCDHFVQNGDPVRISAIQFLTTAVISWIAAFWAESPALDKIVSAAIPILYCGIISGGLGYTLQITAQQYTDPTVASLLMSLESVFAAIAGAVLLNEHMSTRELLGCIVMFIAIILVQIPLPRKEIKQ